MPPKIGGPRPVGAQKIVATLYGKNAKPRETRRALP
jgi:hypothetical protein